MTKKVWWTITFLGVFTLGALGMELWASFDRDPGTRPWTDYITDLPIEVVLAATGALIIWLPIHFWRAWSKKQKEREAAESTMGQSPTVAEKEEPRETQGQ